jgi:hypothetical protein
VRDEQERDDANRLGSVGARAAHLHDKRVDEGGRGEGDPPGQREIGDGQEGEQRHRRHRVTRQVRQREDQVLHRVLAPLR